jgi:orotate phosphoribosyltransferase
VSVFNYGFTAAANLFEQEGIRTLSLSHYNALLDLALEKQLIQSSELNLLEKWRENPDKWGQ